MNFSKGRSFAAAALLICASLIIPQAAASEENSFAQLASQGWDTVTQTAMSLIQIDSEADLSGTSETDSSLHRSLGLGHGFEDLSWMSIIDLVKSSQL